MSVAGTTINYREYFLYYCKFSDLTVMSNRKPRSRLDIIEIIVPNGCRRRGKQFVLEKPCPTSPPQVFQGGSHLSRIHRKTNIPLFFSLQIAIIVLHTLIPSTMNRKGSRRGWMSRVGWGKRKVSRHHDDVPLHVALGKVSRSILDDEITLESGDIFTGDQSSDEDLELIVPPCRLRQIDETRADSSCDDDDDDNSVEKKDNSEVPRETSLQRQQQQEEDTSTKEEESSATDQEMMAVPKCSLVDFTTAPLTPWVCW